MKLIIQRLSLADGVRLYFTAQSADGTELPLTNAGLDELWAVIGHPPLRPDVQSVMSQEFMPGQIPLVILNIRTVANRIATKWQETQPSAVLEVEEASHGL